MSSTSQTNFPVQKGILQSSESVTWNTADNLGRGATAIVYLGRDKKDGSLVAVKVFHDHIRMVAGGDEVRELELLRKLKHENIITLFSIQREVVSKRVVLIMQYCEGGSLYHMLDQPQYVYGFPKDQFMLVLKDVASGIEYLRQQGIVHRDIKPGNIMRYVTEDGKSIYKLTDFGAARELHEEENFTSLYGTEEYLHPGMYERAVLRLPTGQRFDAKVDLWSLGVTFYHVATGDLPFKPYGGRNNKQKMFEIISQKASGVISGVQNFDKGPINWSYELPQTCPMSRGLKQLIVPLLAGLMECDDLRVISYEKFFMVVNRIINKVIINVFHPSSGSPHEVYLDKTDSFSALQEKVASLTDIPASNQLLIVNGKPLEEIVAPSDEVSSYPLHILNSTIFLYHSDYMVKDREKVIHPEVPRVPDFVNFIEMDKDLRVAHSCTSRAHLIKRYTEETVRVQELLVQSELQLRLYLQTRLKSSGERYLTMSHLLSEFKKRLSSFYSMLDMIKMLLRLLRFNTLPLEDATKDRTIITVNEKAEERTREIIEYRTALVEKIDQDEARTKKWCARCRDTECITKVGHHLSVITAVQSRFRRDKNVKDQMTSHDTEIHAFERQKLQTQCVAIASILQDHCYRNLDIMMSESSNFNSCLSRNLNRISKIDKNIESVIECQQLLSNKLDKIEAKCKEIFEKAQREVTNDCVKPERLQPTAPMASNPELHRSTSVDPVKESQITSGYGTDHTSDVKLGASSSVSEPNLSTAASDITEELHSLMMESMQIAGLVEENTELIRRFEENTLQSQGSLSRNLSKAGVN